MKTTRSLLLHRIMSFTAIVSIICCIGCSDIVNDILDDIGDLSSKDPDPLDDQWVITDMPIHTIAISPAVSQQVQVVVEVNGWLPDSCTEYHETHQERIGNVIIIQITTIRPKDVACATVVTPYQAAVVIDTLPAGDYVVIVNDIAQQFRLD